MADKRPDTWAEALEDRKRQGAAEERAKAEATIATLRAELEEVKRTIKRLEDDAFERNIVTGW